MLIALKVLVWDYRDLFCFCGRAFKLLVEKRALTKSFD